MPYIGAQPIPKASLVLTEGTFAISKQIIDVPAGYNVANIAVYLNGYRLQTSEYTATDGLTVDLGEVFPVGTEYSIEEYRSFQLPLHYTKTESDDRYYTKDQTKDTFVQLDQFASLPIFFVRAWASFNGKETVGIVTDWVGGNIDHIERTGTGLYTAYFNVDMPDTDYGFYGTCSDNDHVVNIQQKFTDRVSFSTNDTGADNNDSQFANTDSIDIHVIR